MDPAVKFKVLPDTEPSFSRSATAYPRSHFYIAVRRRIVHAINIIMFPLFLITLLSHASLELDVDDLGNRFSVSLTMMLAAVTFKFVIVQELPNVNYMTLLDK